LVAPRRPFGHEALVEIPDLVHYARGRPKHLNAFTILCFGCRTIRPTTYPGDPALNKPASFAAERAASEELVPLHDEAEVELAEEVNPTHDLITHHWVEDAEWGEIEEIVVCGEAA